MSVPKTPRHRTIPASSVTGDPPTLSVEEWLADHAVARLDVPTKDCPDCKRGLYAVGVFLTGTRTAVWHMKCPVHHTDFGVEVNE